MLSNDDGAGGPQSMSPREAIEQALLEAEPEPGADADRSHTLERIRDWGGAFDFRGQIAPAAEKKLGRGSRRDTGGFRQMDPEGARNWAEAELRRELDAEDWLPDALFGGASDYPIPPTYAEIVSAERFRLRADDDPSMQ